MTNFDREFEKARLAVHCGVDMEYYKVMDYLIKHIDYELYFISVQSK